MAKTSTPKNKPLKEDAPTAMDTLPATLKRLEKMIAGAASGQVVISPLKSKTLVSLQTQGSVAEATIPQPIEGAEGPLGFPFTFLSSVLLNRDSAQFKVKNGHLFVKDKRYEAELPGSEVAALVRVEKPEETACDVAMTPAVWGMLRDMTAQVKISRSLAAMPDITVHFLFTKKMAMAVAFDKYQLAAMAVKNTYGLEFSLTLPLSVAETLFKNPAGADRLMASESIVYVKSGNLTFSSSLPIVEEAAGVPIDVAVAHAKNLRTLELKKTVVIPKTELKKFLDNSRALSSANAILTVNVGDSHTNVTLASDGNSITAKLPSKSKKAFQFRLDISYVNTIVEKSGEDIQLEIDDSMVIFRTDMLVYSSVLSVDDQSDDDEPKPKKKRKDDDE